jgi:glycerol-3-phosphate dehydrogenase
MDEPSAKKVVRPSQGVHIVIGKRFLNGSTALMIPKTPDGRVLFAVPWHEHVLLGTTDTPLNKNSLEPVPLASEISFILNTVKDYMAHPPSETDVLSVFAGLRPLAATSKDQSTKELSRDHKLFTSKSGLITITGGKWTTYRKMAQETIDLALSVAGLTKVNSETKTIKLHGCTAPVGNRLSIYGTDREGIEGLISDDPSLGEILVKGHGYTKAEVVWSIRYEMVRTVEDVLARRLRLLFLDAEAAIEAAPQVAEIIAKEAGLPEEIKLQQLQEFYKIANQYKLKP